MISEQPIVEIREVVKSFPVGGTTITILKGVSFKVKAGEFVSIVGPSGNGKSTLLNMITGIDRPTSGEIIVTGRQVHKMSEDSLAAWRGENVGIIFQFFQMLPALSILQNVVLPMDLAGKYTARERRARAAPARDRRDGGSSGQTSRDGVRRAAAARGNCARARERSAAAHCR